MDHKYKALLKSVPTKSIITEIVGPEQIVRLRKLDITNFFILGRLESIRAILGDYFNIRIFPFDQISKIDYSVGLESVRPDYFEKNFAWHIITHEFGNVSVCCGNISMMFLRPKIYQLPESNQIQLRASFYTSFHTLTLNKHFGLLIEIKHKIQ